VTLRIALSRQLAVYKGVLVARVLNEQPAPLMGTQFAIICKVHWFIDRISP
jgi:hypothetical protein